MPFHRTDFIVALPFLMACVWQDSGLLRGPRRSPRFYSRGVMMSYSMPAVSAFGDVRLVNAA